MTALGILVAIYVGVNWSTMPVLHGRTVLLRPDPAPLGGGPLSGGFVELITENLHLTSSGRHFGEIVTAAS
jgi:hypothetical protein